MGQIAEYQFRFTESRGLIKYIHSGTEGCTSTSIFISFKLLIVVTSARGIQCQQPIGLCSHFHWLAFYKEFSWRFWTFGAFHGVFSTELSGNLPETQHFIEVWGFINKIIILTFSANIMLESPWKSSYLHLHKTFFCVKTRFSITK